MIFLNCYRDGLNSEKNNITETNDNEINNYTMGV